MPGDNASYADKQNLWLALIGAGLEATLCG
jgi:hypothetical protein